MVLQLTFVMMFIVHSASAAESWKKLWETADLPNPESVVYDSERKILFVSLQAYGAKPGNGSIAKMTIDGKLISPTWVSGLNEPKGMALHAGKLFVSDLTELVEIDIESAKVLSRYKGTGAKFLNDVAINGQGEVFVSDMFNSSIYKLGKDKKLQVWLESPLLENPNGLLVQGDRLLVAAWGRFTDQKPLNAKKGNLLSVSLKDKKISTLTASPMGNLDGIQQFQSKRFLVSDWVSGSISVSDENFMFQKTLELEQSVGDIAFLEDQKLLLIPMAKQGKVLAYKLQN